MPSISAARRVVAAVAALLASANPVLAADTCNDLLREHASLSMQIGAVEDEYPQTVRVYRQCGGLADKASNIGEAVARLLICAAPQCAVIGMDTCDSVFKTMARLERNLEKVKTRQRELGC